MKTATVEKMFKTISFEIKSIDTDNRTFQAVASDPSVDRHGESIDQDGWVLENFLKNPVILLNHDYDGLPVAQAISIGFDQDGRLIFTPKFATADEYDLADTVFKLYQGGYMRAFSVGFIPLDAEWDKVNEVFLYTKMELLEISAVTVPSNPNALALAYKEGVVTEDGRKKLIATHKSIVKALTEVAPKPQTESIDEDSEVSKEVLEAITKLAESVDALSEKVDGLTPITEEPVVDEEADTAVEAESDKPVDESDAGGAEEVDVTEEEAQKIIAEEVEKALDAARGKVT